MQTTSIKKNLMSEIHISRELINFDNKEVKIFALDSCTIGLSGNPLENWKTNSLWSDNANLTDDEKGWTLLLPQELISFYLPNDIEISVDEKKTRILLFINKRNA